MEHRNSYSHVGIIKYAAADEVKPEAPKEKTEEMTKFTKRRLTTKALLSALKLGALGAVGGGLAGYHNKMGDPDAKIDTALGALIGGAGGALTGYGAGQLGGRARMFLGLDPLVDTQAVTQVHKA